MHDPMPPVCEWPKRDLRFIDHPALAEACARARGGAVFAAFLYEPEVPTGCVRTTPRPTVSSYGRPAARATRSWMPACGASRRPAGVPSAHVHAFWTMPAAVQQAADCVLGRDYPPPIVDHATAVREAKRRLALVRGDLDARAEARDVALRHGSRRDRHGAMQQDPVRQSPARGAAARTGRAAQPPDPRQKLPFLDADECRSD